MQERTPAGDGSRLPDIPAGGPVADDPGAAMIRRYGRRALIIGGSVVAGLTIVTAVDTLINRRFRLVPSVTPTPEPAKLISSPVAESKPALPAPSPIETSRPKEIPEHVRTAAVREIRKLVKERFQGPFAASVGEAGQKQLMARLNREGGQVVPNADSPRFTAVIAQARKEYEERPQFVFSDISDVMGTKSQEAPVNKSLALDLNKATPDAAVTRVMFAGRVPSQGIKVVPTGQVQAALGEFLELSGFKLETEVVDANTVRIKGARIEDGALVNIAASTDLRFSMSVTQLSHEPKVVEISEPKVPDYTGPIPSLSPALSPVSSPFPSPAAVSSPVASPRAVQSPVASPAVEGPRVVTSPSPLPSPSPSPAVPPRRL